MSADQLNLDAFMTQAMEYEAWDDPSDRVRRFFAEINRTHPYAVRRVSEVMKWVQSGEYDRIQRGEYRPREGRPKCARRPATPSSSTPSASARSSARWARTSPLGTQVGGVAEQVADWIRARGGRAAPAAAVRTSRAAAPGQTPGVVVLGARSRRDASPAGRGHAADPRRPDGTGIRRIERVRTRYGPAEPDPVPAAHFPLTTTVDDISLYRRFATEGTEMSHDEMAAHWPIFARWGDDPVITGGRRPRTGASAIRTWIIWSGWPRCGCASVRPLRRSRRGAAAGRGRPARWRPRPPAPRRRPHRAADAARRGAPQRLPADADDRGAKRRTVAPEPRLGLPDPGPARGRGPDPGDRARRHASCSRSPTSAASA